MNIILDTDIGDDIDDALALALALHSPEISLQAITTVFRNAPRRAAFTSQLLKDFGKEIPIFAGISKPLLQSFDPKLGAQFQWLQNDIWTKPEHAVDYLIQAARIDEEPGEPLTVVPIGPLTNIAVALAREPELVPRIRLVVMGGCFFKEYAEWNIACDPEAAAIVVESGIEVSFIGLDVTEKCRLDADQTSKLQQAQPSLSEIIRLWVEESKHAITLHDPLALATLWSDTVRFEEKRIEVVLSGDARGQMRIVEGTPNARIAVEVDADAAKKDFLSRLF